MGKVNLVFVGLSDELASPKRRTRRSIPPLPILDDTTFGKSVRSRLEKVKMLFQRNTPPALEMAIVLPVHHLVI